MVVVLLREEVLRTMRRMELALGVRRVRVRCCTAETRGFRRSI